MFKQIVYLVIASLLAALFMSYFHQVVLAVLQAYGWVHHWLAEVFAHGYVGTLLISLLSIFLIPLAVGLLVGGVYWMVKRQQFLYIAHVMWTTWIVLATMLMLKSG
jgi:hypothetical protein